MTGPRTAWIIFCCAVAVGWIFVYGLEAAYPEVMLSLFAIFIPIGKERQEVGKQRHEDSKRN